MKKFILSLLCFSLVSMVAKAQYYNVDVNFESTTNSVIRIDTANHANCWQIGRPQKTLFDSALSAPNAIVTDTIHPYPINTNSSFQFTVYDSAYILYGFHSWGQLAPTFSFDYKMDSDSLLDGGYIEYSLDSGASFSSITFGGFSECFYNATVLGGIPANTGNSNGWKHCELRVCFEDISFFINFKNSIVFRFTFISDSINTGKDGWMIDNLKYNIDLCEGIHEASKTNTVTVYPVPASTSIGFQSDEVMKNATLIIYDDKGQKVRTIEKINGNQWNLTNQNFNSGIYFYQLFNAHRWSASGKFIFQ